MKINCLIVYLVIILLVIVVGNGNGKTISNESISMSLLDSYDAPLVARIDATKLNNVIEGFINKRLEDTSINLKRNIINEIFTGKYPLDCEDVGIVKSGIYRIYPTDIRGFDVFCEMDIENGGWTVIQRRIDGSVDFFRNWMEYKNGFGNLNSEFWLGNNKLHEMTSKDEYELYIILEDFDNETRYARYGTFRVGDIASGFTLTVSDYSGNAGDAMIVHSSMPFSTKDKDRNDCVKQYKGGWWYNECHTANLNGLYLNGVHTSYADGIEWYPWKGLHYSLKRVLMLIRRRR